MKKEGRICSQFQAGKHIEFLILFHDNAQTQQFFGLLEDACGRIEIL